MTTSCRPNPLVRSRRRLRSVCRRPPPCRRRCRCCCDAGDAEDAEDGDGGNANAASVDARECRPLSLQSLAILPPAATVYKLMLYFRIIRNKCAAWDANTYSLIPFTKI